MLYLWCHFQQGRPCVKPNFKRKLIISSSISSSLLILTGRLTQDIRPTMENFWDAIDPMSRAFRRD